MSKSKYEILLFKTNNVRLVWNNAYGIATNKTAAKLDKAMLNWQYELTKSLKIWIDKGLSMTEGELILAQANIGAVVESWLKLFYCANYDDYCNEPLVDKKGKIVEPENMSFENLKKFSCEKLWEDELSKEYVWVDSVQHKRNAIHSFKYRDIGTNQDFLDDVDFLCDFVNNVINHLPSLEDCIEVLPAGYVISPYL